jgi:hypothetical protein
MSTLQQQADALFEEQKTSWPLLGSNWKLLKAVQVKEFRFDGYSVRVQFNPERIRSSAAKVDRTSIESRPCFLCQRNRPPEEKGVWFRSDYEILCNPFPIFEAHFTIARPEHTPQLIRPEFSNLLELSRALPDLVVFYNAPACGASAPDHMHFQAGNRGLMPIEQEIMTLRKQYGRALVPSGELGITAISDGLRRFFLLESQHQASLETAFYLIFDFIREYQGEEPMINLLCYYNQGWQLYLFPREQHRPRQYFEEGKDNILLSPAAVDMGGTLIMPLEKDFRAITAVAVLDIFSQVTCSEHHFDAICELIRSKLTANEA